MAEIELKLEISPEDVSLVLNSKIFGSPVGTKQLRSTYYDTSERTLFDNGYTLRIRESGGERIQTVKASDGPGSIFARDEWESALADDEIVIDHSTPLMGEFKISPDDVSPQFDVRVERTIWNVEENGAQIEVVLDQGHAIAVERQAPIIEIELELKQGDPKALFALARKIGAVVPVKIGVQTKSERGFMLLESVRGVVKAETVEMRHDMSATKAFEVIAEACFRQFRLNENILLVTKNVEALHQARVSLRRLRSALTIFKPILNEDEAKLLSHEFRWLAGVLGQVRDLDVLLPKAESDGLRKELKQKREAAFQIVVETLKSRRASNLMIDFKEWLHCGNVDANRKEASQSASEFAARALDKRRRRLKKHGAKLTEISDDQRHEVRKDAKKLRYASEFFRSLFSDKRGARRHQRFVAAMEALQDELGDLNDLATGPDTLRANALEDHAEASKLISHADKDELVERAQEAMDDVLDAKRFWK